ncbi:Rho GTPase-activating protein gacY [Porphyridium purpureum]|uniref:Rho GTPase-activating protein gacY n=1 Tax=Porphyridium purpureum TaxID=35688 RepID=A0A5J4YML2_PORPP|nr:Rho GTPase-activating protein gacY [Porphyridium purpureum]|eukprot:POR3538..scf246_12
MESDEGAVVVVAADSEAMAEVDAASEDIRGADAEAPLGEPLSALQQAPVEEYLRVLEEARAANLEHIEALNVFEVVEDDGHGRPVMMVHGSRLDTWNVDMHDVLLLFIRLLHPCVFGPGADIELDDSSRQYSVIFFHTNMGWRNQPSVAFAIRAYRLLPTAYKKNLAHLSIVHPGVWVRGVFLIMRPFLSSKFWAKLHYADRLDELWLDGVLNKHALEAHVPPEARRFEEALRHELADGMTLMRGLGYMPQASELTTNNVYTADDSANDAPPGRQ